LSISYRSTSDTISKENFGIFIVVLFVGPLSHQPWGNLSLFIGMYYKAERESYQRNSGFRELNTGREKGALDRGKI